VSLFLTCGIRYWLKNLGFELKPRFSKSRKFEIFKYFDKVLKNGEKLENRD
jgi:hypothetical protein